MSIAAADVASICHELGYDFSDDVTSKLTTYLQLLDRWNSKINLVGPRKWQDILKTLIVDSFELANVLHKEKFSQDAIILDLGSGAGLPGIPLRMIWEKGNYYLVEPLGKREVFLGQVLREIKLPIAGVLKVKAETVPEQYKPAQLIISRAFRPWLEVVKLSESLLSLHGKVVIMANDPSPEDLPQGWEVTSEWHYCVEEKNRYFWLMSFVGGST